MLEFRFIASDEDFEQTCAHLSRQRVICVDLEADSLHAFKEKICLIQIATPDQAFLVDPFFIQDLTPFVSVLENPDIVKVFHGADFDIRSLDRETGARITRLFDTEIACRFLNIRERGLAALLKHYFDVHVDKKFQKQDWSRRPLDPEMIAYSVMDVSHLIPLYHQLHQELEAKNRLAWAQEEFEAQTRVRYEDPHIPPHFRKFKGAGKLDGRSLAILENLLTLRMELAEKRDVPLFKVMSGQSILAMVQTRHRTVEEMVADKTLSSRQARMFGPQCRDAIAAAMALPAKSLPAYPRTIMPSRTPAVMARIQALKKYREKTCDQLAMEPGFLLNNTAIAALAFENPASPADLSVSDSLRTWQKQVLGPGILQTLKQTA